MYWLIWRRALLHLQLGVSMGFNCGNRHRSCTVGWVLTFLKCLLPIVRSNTAYCSLHSNEKLFNWPAKTPKWNYWNLIFLGNIFFNFWIFQQISVFFERTVKIMWGVCFDKQFLIKCCTWRQNWVTWDSHAHFYFSVQDGERSTWGACKSAWNCSSPISSFADNATCLQVSSAIVSLLYHCFWQASYFPGEVSRCLFPSMSLNLSRALSSRRWDVAVL